MLVKKGSPVTGMRPGAGMDKYGYFFKLKHFYIYESDLYPVDIPTGDRIGIVVHGGVQV